MLPNVVLVTNGKGGTCKTSLTANLAASAAGEDWRILAVDLDPQGNLARDLGYLEASDDGASLSRAVRSGGVPDLITDVRPGLDVVAGGSELDEMIGELQRAAMRGDLPGDRLEAVLEPLCGQYDLVVCDLPPGEPLLQTAAYTAGHYLLIPTQADAGSRDGIGRVADRVAKVQTLNPSLELLGVVLVLLPARATVLSYEARKAIGNMFGTTDIVCAAEVRQATKAALQCRERGVTAAEYEHAMMTAPRREWYQADSGWSKAAEGLATDYQALATEVLTRYRARQGAAA